MEVDIVEVITIMAELENSGLVQGIKWRFNTQRTWKSAQPPPHLKAFQIKFRYGGS